VKFHIAHPRLLASLVILAVAAGTALTVFAATRDSGNGLPPANLTAIPVGPTGTHPTPVPVSSDDLSRIRKLITEDGRLAKLTGGQPFDFTDVRAETSERGTRLVALEAVWTNPIDTSGPWLEIECQMTVQYTSIARWTGLRSVAIYTDLGKGSIEQFVPGITATQLGGELDSSSINPSKAPTCPEGKSDD
jgi:hypothetical protein